ncbi:hypothetical protein BMR04_01285 [Methylococcaceae bacterium HT3]|nr:hypothetical protein BMR04_01285 [Methylococcaceae bacterium HT3]
MMVCGAYPTMSDYRRLYTGGNIYFFTVVMHRRQKILCNDDLRPVLREAITTTRKTHPFDIDAWVLMPDHLHCIWTMPEGDNNFVIVMASLVVRDIDADVVKALKARAGLHGVSAEAEHRKILESVLLRPKKKSFTEVLLTMPNVGDDLDFKREQAGSIENVFD